MIAIALRMLPVLTLTLLVLVAVQPVHAGPSAAVAKQCMRYAYLAHPYKRPGSVKMSGDRQAYFRDCMSKEGNVPEPTPPR